MVKEYKNALGIRGDMLYCPLPLYIDSYWTCEPNCKDCFARKLNRTWGWDFRIANVEKIKKRLLSGRGTSPLSKALAKRKTLRLGNRSDPFQNCEEKYRVSSEILNFLLEEQKWETVIQTKHPQRVWDMAHLNNYAIVLAVVTVGLEKDWELLERKKTENPIERIKTLKQMKIKNISVGVNGEPFIPGYHTVSQFQNFLKLLKSNGINRFNTYNLHFNDWVAKQLHEAGLDIERIWWYNQDTQWKKILSRLLDLGKKYDIIIGCPDFVNSGKFHTERANTCCGIDVRNPCTFNTHYFKKALQKGEDPMKYWEGIGNKEEGLSIITGKNRKMYTLKDAGF